MKIKYFKMIFCLSLMIGFSQTDYALAEFNELVEAKHQAFLYRLHTHSFHHVLKHKKRLIQLKDGSVWNVHEDDVEKMVKWRKHQEIFIKPAYSWLWPDFFIVYKYVLYNKNLNEVIGVYLTGLPAEEKLEVVDSIQQPQSFRKNIFLNHYAGSRWLEGIEPQKLMIENYDSQTHILQLSDSTCWQMNSHDPAAILEMSNWKVGDTLIIGVNNKWHTADFPQILINVSVNQCSYIPAIFKPNHH